MLYDIVDECVCSDCRPMLMKFAEPVVADVGHIINVVIAVVAETGSIVFADTTLLRGWA